MDKIVEKLEEWVKQYSKAIVRWRWLVIALSIGTVFFLGSGGRFLGFATDYRVFFDEGNPQLETFEKLQNVYTKNDNVLFVIAPKDKNVFKASTLNLVEELTTEGWKMPYAIRVDSIQNYQHTRADGDNLVVEDLIVDPEKMTKKQLDEAKNISLNEPTLIHRTISKEAHVTGVSVTFELPGKTIMEVPEVVEVARGLVKKMEAKYPDIDIYLTGMVMLNNAFSEAAQKDMKSLVPLMYLGMFIIMFILLRSVSATVATILVILFSTMGAMGIAGWFHIKLTPPSAQAPTIIMTLAIADSVHILITLFQKMRLGMKKWDAIVESLRINMQPVFLTSLTTAIGFLSMNFSEVPPLRHLGNVTAVGVGMAFLLSVVLLPALIAILPIRPPKTKNGDWKWVEKFSTFIENKYRPVLLVSIMVISFLALGIPKNDLNDQFIRYFDHSIEFRRDTDFYLENLSGLYQIEHSLGAGESNGISDPAYLKKLQEFENWYRQQPGVVHIQTFTDVMKRLNKNMHGDDPAFYRLPDNRELAAQYLLLYELSLPYGLDLNNQINIDKSETRFSVTLSELSSKEIRALTEKAEDWLRQNAPETMFSYGSGPAVMFSYISGRNISSMIKGTILALLIISFSLIFAFRSLKFGLLSLIPNVVPGIMGFGLWGLLVGRINLGLSIVLGMALGIVVDDTIHFLAKFIRAQQEDGLSATKAVHYAFTSVGKALVVTSTILIGGFFILSQSNFAMNQDMATLTGIIIILALVADFLMLPSLLISFERKKQSVATNEEESNVKTVATQ